MSEPDIENHKGQPCKLDPNLLCQEGYCSECYLWTKWDELLKGGNSESSQ